MYSPMRKLNHVHNVGQQTQVIRAFPADVGTEAGAAPMADA